MHYCGGLNPDSERLRDVVAAIMAPLEDEEVTLFDRFERMVEMRLDCMGGADEISYDRLFGSSPVCQYEWQPTQGEEYERFIRTCTVNEDESLIITAGPVIFEDGGVMYMQQRYYVEWYDVSHVQQAAETLRELGENAPCPAEGKSEYIICFGADGTPDLVCGTSASADAHAQWATRTILELVPDDADIDIFEEFEHYLRQELETRTIAEHWSARSEMHTVT